ncbi:uncharacterized protein LAJ45_10473 [Morchella importuna]|uniref:uncharacterized protein n=1 Tax=Morchella importuna TaxID=1174673 RepID=UPI001E8CB747|nr:uncharacterized protein LAJ45_10473 [Morchella importuna]KAH8145503.1 hypothetical protein LAJ45_10473 [Morchella importuna]
MPPKRSTRSEHPTLEAIPPKVRNKPPTANRKSRASPEPVYNVDEVAPEKDNVAPAMGRRPGGKKKRASGKRSLPRMETQDVIVLSNGPSPASLQKNVEESETEEEEVEESQVSARRAHSLGGGEIASRSRSEGRKPRRAQSVGDAQSIPRTRSRSRNVPESSDQPLPSSPPRIPSTPGGDRSPPLLSAQETQEQEEMDEILRAAVNSPAEPPSKGSDFSSHGENSESDGSLIEFSPVREVSPFQIGKHFPKIRQMRRERKSYLDYDDPLTPKPASDTDASSSEDDQEIDDLTLFTLRTKQYDQALANVRSRMQDLSAAFAVLESLQHVATGKDKGYLNLLSDLTHVIINNDAPQLSKEEKFQLGVFDEAMLRLAYFEQETKDFELIFNRFLKHNNTQRRNIEKCRAGIRKTMKKRGYKNMAWLVTEQGEEEEGNEKKKASERRVKSVLADLEGGSYGYNTPESANERGRKRRKTGEDEYEEEGRPESRLQKKRRIELVERVRRLDDSLRTDRDEGRRRKDAGNETGEGTREAIIIRDDDHDNDNDDEQDVVNDHRGEGVEEGVEGDNVYYHEEQIGEEDDVGEQVVGNGEEMQEAQEEESDVEEVLPIIIDEDDVEIVRVEGFGERQKKAREREERLERDEGEVEVLEDHDWEDSETFALLDGISKIHGGVIETRFSRIKNRYRAELESRSVEAIIERARELKKEIIDSGEEHILGGFWDGI